MEPNMLNSKYYGVQVLWETKFVENSSLIIVENQLLWKPKYYGPKYYATDYYGNQLFMETQYGTNYYWTPNIVECKYYGRPTII